ncbi:MAG: cohesin domain-containing protein [Candidatus Edwardsbacteria bacterium]|nr:cohesin domain-containing protein [Candidatus Edwardsbacteria bacterium]
MRSILLLALAAGLLLTPGCTTRTAPAHSNPFDPDNSGYANPGVVIVSGPADGQTTNSSTVSFSWQGQGSAVEFSYSLGTAAWSGWSAGTACTIDALYEEPYTFRVRARNADRGVGATVSRTFTVNSVAGPSLMVKPRAVTAGVGDTIELACMLEEVATPVLAAHLVLNYTAGALSLISADTGQYWSANNGSPIGPFDNSIAGKADYSIAVTGGSPAGVTGSGRILKLRFSAAAIGSTTVTYDAVAGIRDTLNAPISLNDRTSCTIVVQ